MIMMMKCKAVLLPLIIVLLVSLFQGAAAAENVRPQFVAKNIQETKLSVPPELQEYDYVRPISIVTRTQALSFLLIRAWNEGTLDGMVDLWFFKNEEFTFLETIRGDARPWDSSSIAYKDDGSVGIFHVGRGGLWMIDGSTKKVEMITNGLGQIRYFAIMNDGTLYFTVKSRTEMWTSDWTKEGTVKVQSFEGNLGLVRSVTDGFVLQFSNSSLYYWGESDRSATYLPGIEIDMCMPSDIAAIPGDNGSKALIAANGLWSIGRHSPKLLADQDDFGWITYLGQMRNEVLLNMYKEESSFQRTDGEGFRPFSLISDDLSSNGHGSRMFGPFANSAHVIFLGNSFFSIENEDATAAEAVAKLTDPQEFSGFLPLLEENKLLIRTAAKLFEFDAATNEVRLLVDWGTNVYVEPEPSWHRDRTWDNMFVFRDGSMLMPMRKVAQRRPDRSFTPLEFWSIQLNATNTDAYYADDYQPPADTTSVDDSTEPNTTPPTGGEASFDDSSSSMVPLVVAQLGTAVLLVLFGTWM